MLNNYNDRHFTFTLLELIDGGFLDSSEVVEMCIKHMSEDEVKVMMLRNNLIPYDLVEDEA